MYFRGNRPGFLVLSFCGFENNIENDPHFGFMHASRSRGFNVPNLIARTLSLQRVRGRVFIGYLLYRSEMTNILF